MDTANGIVVNTGGGSEIDISVLKAALKEVILSTQKEDVVKKAKGRIAENLIYVDKADIKSNIVKESRNGVSDVGSEALKKIRSKK